jgi:hypothetical protein
MEDRPRHHRRALTPAFPAGAELLALPLGPPATVAGRGGWLGGGSQPADVFGHLEDSTISAWSVILSSSCGGVESSGVAGC